MVCFDDVLQHFLAKSSKEIKNYGSNPFFMLPGARGLTFTAIFYYLFY
jgi:hypothetical protein